MDREEKSIEDWKRKCLDLENVIKVLSTHCTKVIQKHQELLVNYKKNQDQYNVLVRKLTEQREQVKKARDVLEPVTQEYQALREKYEIAIRCQQEAENWATQMNKDNKKLKRQSNLLKTKVSGLNVVEINFDDEEEGDDESEDEIKKYYQKLDKQIEDLSEERSALSAEVKTLTENYAIEKEENGLLKEKLEALKSDLQEAGATIDKQNERMTLLTETSEAALNEYKALAEDYAKQIVDEQQARQKQIELSVENKAVKRQSALLMQNISGDLRLQKALTDVEDLTAKLETIRHELQEKIDQLEQQLRSEKERHGVADLESENTSLVEERDSLLTRLKDAETSAADYEKKYSTLFTKYADLETKYEMALKAPIPPPPPPPPPPPVIKTSNILGLISSGKKKRKAQLENRLKKGGAELDDSYSKAVAEMMDRIKSGRALRPVLKSRTQSLPEEDKSAMSELEGVLSKMKRARSDDDLSDMSVFDQPGGIRESTDLGKAFQKIVARKNQGEKPSRPVPAPRKPSVIREENEAED